MTRAADWHRKQERGSLVAMRLLAWLYRHVGDGFARLLLYPIVGYFFLTDRATRAASADYLQRIWSIPEGRRSLGTRPTTWTSFRHCMQFGNSLIDRVGIWLGRHDDLEIDIQGMEELDRVVAEGRGAVFVGAHLGSFDVLRMAANQKSPIHVNVVMFTAHAERINRLFEELDPGGPVQVRVIQVKPGSFDHALEARACVDRGEVVAVLADRQAPGVKDRLLSVDFLGGRVALPRGVWRLASLLDCPVLMMTGLRQGRGRYKVKVERLADTLRVARSEREAHLDRVAQRYADLLGEACIEAPLQWYNFFDFWSQ